jgi:hypothetical protein
MVAPLSGSGAKLSHCEPRARAALPRAHRRVHPLDRRIRSRRACAFFAQRQIQDAVLRRLEILADATAQLSPELKDRHPMSRGGRSTAPQHRRARLPRHRPRTRPGDRDGPSAAAAHRRGAGALTRHTHRRTRSLDPTLPWERGGNKSCPRVAHRVRSCPLRNALSAGDSASGQGMRHARAAAYGTEGLRFGS